MKYFNIRFYDKNINDIKNLCSLDEAKKAADSMLVGYGTTKKDVKIYSNGKVVSFRCWSSLEYNPEADDWIENYPILYGENGYYTDWIDLEENM